MTPDRPLSSSPRRALRAAALSICLAAAASGLAGCVVLLGGAAVEGGLLITDRRTSGAQIEDEAIELKSGSRIRDAIGDRGHVSVTSYNRVALITGEVSSDADRAAVVNTVKGIENVHNVDDELIVGQNASLSTISSDTIITSRVKTAMFGAKDVQSNAVKVVTARGNVYLMGLVTEREAERATDIARSVPSVLKVVRVFEILTEAELANLQNK